MSTHESTYESTRELPPEHIMLDAFLGRDAAYDGIFVTAVRTTGIFCRPVCPARRPKPEHVAFFRTPREALLAGFRPCRRCRPLEPIGAAPDWLRPLLDLVEQDPARRWTDGDVRARGLSPERVRRWFKRHHGMTFQAYNRARRLGAALGRMQVGESVGRAAFDAGWDSLSGFQEAFRRYFGDTPTALDGATLVRVTRVATPLGPMLAGATDDALVLLEFVDRRMLEAQIARLRSRLGAVFAPGTNAVLEKVERELGAYFRGALAEFTVPLRLAGTPFELEVWEELRRIPYGETRSYAGLAQAIGRPAAVRAVGRANGCNALAVVVPCHRVVGADGRLVGYGGGLWRKQRLLELERAAARGEPRPAITAA
ncbi:MAG TPA: trifunctional transcriptional activator/DNA repair protein Ada/methylated-DNA--[protein]-cysteine S-methyltransferase [Longimicrobiales bacterium]|nr:trifunctional transcriptional activator/DNA repair protein Ada/methylated-DNA--[protein]-cysteine S-methyltransferase [Longimicrobiales bacterium]